MRQVHKERSVNALPCIRSDTIAGCQEQAASGDPNMPIGSHFRLEIRILKARQEKRPVLH